MHGFPRALRIAALALPLLLAAGAAAGGEWTNWRGPHWNGVADDRGLVSSWSKDGTNLLWRDDFTGRSTPVVFDRRVCAIGRVGEGDRRQEIVACWNAETGERLWERRFTVYQTDVPWNRVGWANLAADAETGYVFAHTVHGVLAALDRHGEVVWRHQLAEDYGRLSGYGGRTHTPIVDEDRVILGAIGSNWGAHKPPRHRYYAFDKRSGDVLWVSAPGGPPAGDLNTQSTPVVAEIAGQRLLIGGNADGWVHAMQARTGEPVWKFHLSQRGLNASVAVDGTTVFASHSEENVQPGTMGRLVAIDGTGRGDVTSSHEKWRINELSAGFPSPLVHGGMVYAADNSANLHAVDGATGEEKWQYNYGTVGKSSPVWGDGKIYLTEVNGNVLIIAPGNDGAETLDREHLTMPEGRYAEIYGSVAVGYGRVYFTTEEGIYCLGESSRPFPAAAPPAAAPPAAGDGPAALVQIVPAELVIHAGDSRDFTLRAFDAQGRPVRGPAAPTWGLEGLRGSIDASGRATFDAGGGNQVGFVTVKAGELGAKARVRVVGPLPWSEDFESLEPGQIPAHWRPTFKGARVEQLEDGNKVLMQPKAPRGAPRAFIYLGSSDMRGYTIQADVRGNRQGRRYTDLGLIANGYTLDLQGAHQRLQVRSWASERRMAQQVDFPWEMGVWYTMKLRVDRRSDGPGMVIRGKVWKRDEPEPEAWSITAYDPLVIDSGSPGIYTFAPVPSYFDNVKVMVSE